MFLRVGHDFQMFLRVPHAPFSARCFYGSRMILKCFHGCRVPPILSTFSQDVSTGTARFANVSTGATCPPFCQPFRKMFLRVPHDFEMFPRVPSAPHSGTFFAGCFHGYPMVAGMFQRVPDHLRFRNIHGQCFSRGIVELK